jgi:hypothetical protein
MDIEADLLGIHNLLRRHIEIRNRSWMKRVHRDCFIGSEAVDFLVTQGLADNRKQAVEIGRKMVTKKMVRHVTDSQKFGDSYHYYRFAEDDLETSVLAESNAGNGLGTHLGVCFQKCESIQFYFYFSQVMEDASGVSVRILHIIRMSLMLHWRKKSNERWRVLR